MLASFALLPPEAAEAQTIRPNAPTGIVVTGGTAELTVTWNWAPRTDGLCPLQAFVLEYKKSSLDETKWRNISNVTEDDPNNIDTGIYSYYTDESDNGSYSFTIGANPTRSQSLWGQIGVSLDGGQYDVRLKAEGNPCSYRSVYSSIASGTVTAGAPNFENQTIDKRSFTVNVAIDEITLPRASGGTLTYSISPDLPDELNFNPTSRTISGTPTVLTAEQEYTYTATDPSTSPPSASIKFKLEVVTDSTPRFDADDEIKDQEFSWDYEIGTLELPEAKDGDGTLTYTLTPALPPELTFNATDRTITGEPTGPKATWTTTTYTYTATDADNDSASLDFDIAVNYRTTTPFDYVPVGGIQRIETSWKYTDTTGGVCPATLFTVTYRRPKIRFQDVDPNDETKHEDRGVFDLKANVRQFTFGSDPSLPADQKAPIEAGEYIVHLGAASHNCRSSETPHLEWSAYPEGSVTVEVLPQPPAKPTGLTAAAGDAKVTLNWTDPGNTTIKKYQVCHAEGTAAPDIATCNDIANSDDKTTSHIVDGLTNFTEYAFSIRAVNSGGASEASDTVTAKPIPPPGLTITPNPLSLTEGGTAETFTVALVSPLDDATETVTVTLANGDTGAVTLEDTDPVTEGIQSTLTFSDSNWNTAQSVTVTPVDDPDGADESVTVTLTADGDKYGDVTDTLTVNVDDDDQPALTITPTSLEIDEGGTGGTFAVSLAFLPTTTVTLDVTANGDAGVVTVDTNPAQSGLQSKLTFTTGNWNTAQTVTVAPVDDDDGADEMATVLLKADDASGEYAGVEGTVSVEVDDDEPELVITLPPSLSLTEGDLTGKRGSFDVHLKSQPTTTVTVSLTSSDAGAATVSPESLTFIAGDYSTPQTVTVTAVDDPDAADETVTITLDSSGAEYDDQDGTVDFQIADDETPELTIGKTAISLAETGAGATDSFTVELAVPPSSGSVTVVMTNSDPGALTVSPASLTFTTLNWDTTQTVTVTAVEDDDGADESVIVRLNANGDGYTNVKGEVTVSVDDDKTPALTVSKSELTVIEGETTETFTVMLAVLPTADVKVSLTTSGDTDAATVSPTELTFTTGINGNWNTAQTVTVTPVDDADGADEKVTVSLTASGAAEYASVTGSVSVEVDDDEPGLKIEPTSLSLFEDDDKFREGTFNVSLDSQPTTTVTVSVTNPDPDAVTVDTTSLSFTTTNWSTLQPVKVTALGDLNGANESVTITLSGKGNEYDDETGTVTVNVTDDETPELVIEPTSLTLKEGVKDGGSFTVTLAVQPTTTVTVSVISDDTGAATASPAELTFTPSDWKKKLTVTVTPFDDDDGADETVTISLTADDDSGEYAGLTGEVTADVGDNEIPALTISPTSLKLVEGGDPNTVEKTFAVELSVPPKSGEVKVKVESGDAGAAAVDKTLLTFTTADWNTAQTVTVTAQDDDDGANESLTVSLSAPDSTASEYVSVKGSVSVEVDDDDTPALTIASDTTPLALVEGGRAGSFTVALAVPPKSGEVKVSFSSDDPGAATVPSTALTFDATNWNVAQSVTVTPADDADGADESVTVSLSASGSTAPEYASVTGSLSVTVDDDETPALTIASDTTPLALVEGGAAGSFTVALAVPPKSGDVTVSVTSGDTDAATVSPASLTFTTGINGNWNTAQTVTVTPVDDADGADEKVTVSLTASGAAEYASVTGSVSVEVDDDEPGLKIEPTSLSLFEDDDKFREGTFNVSLDSQPTTTVTVSVTNPDPDAVTVDTTSLSFTTTNWSTLQPVKVTALGDLNGANESVTITLSGKGNEYDDETGTVTVNVTDDETPELVIEPTSLTLKEGVKDGGSFTVTLAVQPTTTVTVSVISDDTGAATASPAELTFTPSDWKKKLTVTVTPFDDDDGADETVTISLTADDDSGEYAGLTGEVTADVGDNEIPALTISPTSLKLVEGGDPNTVEKTFAVELSVPPKSGEVKVKVESGDAGAAAVDKTLLTFTTADWNTAQTVTVTAQDDDDGANESLTVSLSAPDSTAPEYVSVKGSVSVEVDDDETPALTIASDTTPLALVEGGRAGSFTVALAVPPKSGEVKVSFSSDDAGAATVPSTALTFDATNWNVAQSVTVTPADDADGADESVTVSLSAPDSTASEYVSVTRSVSVDSTTTRRLL